MKMEEQKATSVFQQEVAFYFASIKLEFFSYDCHKKYTTKTLYAYDIMQFVEGVAIMQDRERKGTDKRKKYLKILGKFLSYSALTLSVILVGTVGVVSGYASALLKEADILTKEDFEKELQGWNQTSYAYFRDASTGQPVLLGRMHSENDRKLVQKLDDVSPYLVKAFLGIEDHDFYEHKGVVPRSILRAVYQHVTGQEHSTGGSTITQQLVKNEIIDERDKTIDRKVKDIVYAIRLERYYDKEEIFVKYLNSAYFSKGANGKHLYGVSAAAHGIFNKPVKDLNLAESAYIAGMVQLPNVYRPFDDERLQRGIKRMHLVLDQMKKFGLINEKEYQEAKNYDIKSSLAKPEDFTNPYEQYPYIITAIEREAKEIFEQIDKREGRPLKNKKDYHNQVHQGGYHIYTSIDKDLYDAMNEAGDAIKRPTRKYKGRRIQEQIGAVMVDNKTGEVLSFYAGKDFDKNEKDFAFDAKNQPGSVMKPLLAYGPALNEGLISPNTQIIDEPIRKAGSSDVYRNAGGNYRGTVSVTQALTYSYNIPAVKIYRELERKIGKEKLHDYIRRMGIPPHEHDGEALVLGGATEGYTVAQMTGAFQMIANSGTYIKPHLITKITDSNGKVIYDASKEIKPDQIFEPQAAYALTQMLRKVVTEGTARRILTYTGGHNVVAKTGTTSNQFDLWLVGSTPEISLGVWSGYEYNFRASDHTNKDAWGKFFESAKKAKPDLIPPGTTFENPGGAIGEKSCFASDCGNVNKSPTDLKIQQKKKENPDHPGANPPTNPDNPGVPPNGGGNEENNNPGGENGGDGGNDGDSGDGNNGDEDGFGIFR